jgi:hypothetical protein
VPGKFHGRGVGFLIEKGGQAAWAQVLALLAKCRAGSRLLNRADCSSGRARSAVGDGCSCAPSRLVWAVPTSAAFRQPVKPILLVVGLADSRILILRIVLTATVMTARRAHSRAEFAGQR